MLSLIHIHDINEQVDVVHVVNAEGLSNTVNFN